MPYTLALRGHRNSVREGEGTGFCVERHASLSLSLNYKPNPTRLSNLSKNLPNPMSWNVFALLDSAPDGKLACELSTVSSARQTDTPRVWRGE